MTSTPIAQATIPDLQWGTLDGVNAIWSESAGPFVAGIVFRVGRADEPLPRTGITHLAEHLALNRFGPETYHRNGSVDGAFVTFQAAGDEETASDFIQHVIRNAARFDAARLGTEANVVNAEAKGMVPSVEARLLWTRYGARGFGLLNSPEFAPRVVDPMDVAAWAERHFVRQNAAFWCTGVPPRWLEVPLPDGTWMPPPPIEPVPQASKPGAIKAETGGVAISFLMPTTAAGDMAVRILERKALAVLRDDRGLSRQVERRTLAIGADTTHVTIMASCADENAALVGMLLLDVIESVIRDSVPMAAIEMGTAFVAAELADPGRRVQLVQAQAHRLLLGGQPQSPEQLLTEWRAIDSRAVATAMADATHSLLMLLPESARWTDTRMPLVEPPNAEPVVGREFHRKTSEHGDGPSELTIGGEGISLRYGKHDVRTVPFEACAGVLYGPGDLRVIIGRDGTTIRVSGADWKDGNVAFEFLDRLIPNALRIPMVAASA